MDATTTRASTVIKSIPTSEMRTQASITIPLSSTRSRTSIKLDPPDTLSTAIEGLLHWDLINHLPVFCGHSSCLGAATETQVARLVIASGEQLVQAPELSNLDHFSTS